MSDMSDIGGVPEIVVSLMQMPEELKQELLRYRLPGKDDTRSDAYLGYDSGWYLHQGRDWLTGRIPLVLKERKG